MTDRISRRQVLGAGLTLAGAAAVTSVLAETALAGTGSVVVPLAGAGKPVPPGGLPWAAANQIVAETEAAMPKFADTMFDVTKFGAKGDGKTDNTAAFAKAISACNAAGGGHVVVPDGTFLTGAVTLLSNVDLHVLGTVKFSTDTKKYPLVFSRWQGIECMNFSPFVYAFGQTNVAVTGTGTLDGQGPSGPWPDWAKNRSDDWTKLQQLAVDGVDPHQRVFGQGHKLAPSFIQFYRCTNVLIDGVHLKNSAMWNLHPVLCTNVTISNVNVLSRGATVDGCDPEACTDVHITGCTFAIPSRNWRSPARKCCSVSMLRRITWANARCGEKCSPAQRSGTTFRSFM